jgi:hypothetical protein
MRPSGFKRVILALVSVAAFASGAAAADAGSTGKSIAAEVARLRDVVSKLPDAILAADERKQLEQQLTTVDDLRQAGRTHAALHGLLRAARYVDAQAFRAAKAAEIKEGMPALDREFPSYADERKRQLETYGAATGDWASAIARATGETALYESRIVHEACLVYGAQVGAMSGYFYLGEARALMGFALFARKLEPKGAEGLPPLKPLAPKLLELEQRLLEAYAGNTASPQASAFARANGALKLAREMDREKQHWGALYQYLLAQQALGQARAPVATREAAELRVAVDSLAARLAFRKPDHTLALAFLQVAQNGLAASDPKPALANAQVVVETVVPAYLELAGEGSR